MNMLNEWIFLFIILLSYYFIILISFLIIIIIMNKVGTHFIVVAKYTDNGPSASVNCFVAFFRVTSD